ncbi:MAG: energy transducer TonB [Sphingomonadales bacterium]
MAKDLPIWKTWKDAYEAASAAIDNDDFALASEAASTAVLLYREDNPDFELNSFLILIYNAGQLIQNHKEDAQATMGFLYPNIQYVLQRFDEYPERFVEIGNLYGSLYLSDPETTTIMSVYKEKAKFLEQIHDVAKSTLGLGHEKTLLAEYNMVMVQRYTRGKRYVRRSLREIHERSIALGYTRMIIKTTVALAGVLTGQFRDYDDAIDLIRNTVDNIGIETLTQRDKQNLFMIVAAALFMDHGPDKAEEMLQDVPYLEAPPLFYDEDGDVKLTPLLRSAPTFRNIHSQRFIVLRFNVNRKGRTEDIDILTSNLSKPNEAAALDAIKTWRYLPDFRDGHFQPVKSVKVAFNVKSPN